MQLVNTISTDAGTIGRRHGDFEQLSGITTVTSKNRDDTVPDLVSRDRDVVLVRRIFSSGKPRGVGNLEWGGNGEGMGRGRSVYE